MGGRDWFWVAFCLVLIGACGWGEDYSTSEPIRTVQASADGGSWQVEGGLDWPQWRGVQRDGRSREEGLIDGWGESGPVELWRRPLGTGYSGLAIANGRLFTMFQSDAEYVVALDALSGEEIWQVRSDASYRNSQGDGPRGAPAVFEGSVYTVGAKGRLLATNAATGEILWSHDLVRDFGGSAPQWGYATSPLVDGEYLFVEPGGSSGHSLAAFDRRSGKLVWGSYRYPAGYSSPMVADFGETRHVLFFTAEHLVSVSPAQGRLLWEVSWETSYDVNAATPVLIPPDRVFVSSGYGTGGAVFEIESSGADYRVEVAWKNRQMRNHFNSSVFFEGHLYGFDEATLKCLDADTGEMKWRQRGLGKGSLILADRKLLILSDRGVLVLARATSSQFEELARSQVLKGKCWTSPALAQHKLYLRNQSEIVCLDLAR